MSFSFEKPLEVEGLFQSSSMELLGFVISSDVEG